MPRIKRVLKKGINIISIPSATEIKIDRLFPKELSETKIEKLNSHGKWVNKEEIQFLNGSFETKYYKTLKPFDILKLNLLRDITIDWRIDFLSYTKPIEPSVYFDKGFHFNEALHLANLCCLIYKKEEEIYDILKDKYDYKHYKFYSYIKKDSNRNVLEKILNNFILNDMIDLQFMHLSRIDKEGRNIIIFVFRGSDSFNDWIINFNAKNNDFGDYGDVHCGYHTELKAFDKITDEQDLTAYNLPHLDIDDIEDINKNSKIILTGHSKGGALATLVGCHLIKRGVKKENLEVYTFGSPAVGDEDFANEFRDKLNLYRVINSTDPVPKLTNLTQLKHFGKEIVLETGDLEVQHGCYAYINHIIEEID